MASKPLMDAVNVAKIRLKAATLVMVQDMLGPQICDFPDFRGLVVCCHMMHYSNKVINCEFITFMAMSAEKKFMEENEYFKRLVDQINFEVHVLEKTLQIRVDKDGRAHTAGLRMRRP